MRRKLEQVFNEKQGAADVTRKVVGEKKALIEERNHLAEENKQLRARVKFLERSVANHQDVARERAIAEDKAKERVAELEKGNEELENYRVEQDKQIAILRQEIEDCRKKLFESCKAIQDTLHRIGAHISLPDAESSLITLAKWTEDSSEGLGRGVAPFAYRCSKVSVEALSALLLLSGCDHFSGLKSSINDMLGDDAKFAQYREAVKPVVKAF